MLNWLKNTFRTLVLYLFWGLRSADKILFGEKNRADGSQSMQEQQDEQNSVYHDLLRGEVTQEVKELRHEMYYSERLSHKYEYVGNGVARVKNKIFTYNGNVEASDGFDIEILQPNGEDCGTLTDNLSEDEYGTKRRKEYSIAIERSYIPKFRLEEYATKIVVKRINDTTAMLDLYTPMYQQQFNKVHRIFLNELDRVYQGNKKSEIVDFDSLRFVTFRAYGADDLMLYEYDNIQFDNIVKFDGDYVLKFIANIVKDGEDLLDEFYDETAAEKFKNKTPRKENTTIDFLTVMAQQEDVNTTEDAEVLFEQFKNQENTAVETNQ